MAKRAQPDPTPAPADDTVAMWPASRLADAIGEGRLGSRDLLELYLDRIDRHNGGLNAVVTLEADRARAEADAADVALRNRGQVGPLHGVPFTVKDAIETAGIRTTSGAVELADHVPEADAPAVDRLRRAGAILFGKTNTPQWCGDIETFNDVFGTTNNPWATDRTPGGSSGGAAAAVAAGLTGFELGTDIGGSIRAPSHFCGVFGLKTTYGAVPGLGYLDHVGGGVTVPDINVLGPIARSAADLDLLVGVLAGPVPEDSVAWRLDLPDAPLRTAGGLRAGVWFDDPACELEHDYRDLLEATTERLAGSGAIVTRDAAPAGPLGPQFDLYMSVVTATSPDASDDSDDGAAAVGSHASWLRAHEQRAELRRTWAQWFDDHDVLLCPVTAGTAFPHHQSGDVTTRMVTIDDAQRPLLETARWNCLFSLLGLPSAVAPIGRTSAGLPAGIQVIAPHLHDRRAARVAGLIAELAGGYAPPPRFAPGS